MYLFIYLLFSTVHVYTYTDRHTCTDLYTCMHTRIHKAVFQHLLLHPFNTSSMSASICDCQCSCYHRPQYYHMVKCNDTYFCAYRDMCMCL